MAVDNFSLSMGLSAAMHGVYSVHQPWLRKVRRRGHLYPWNLPFLFYLNLWLNRVQNGRHEKKFDLES